MARKQRTPKRSPRGNYVDGFVFVVPKKNVAAYRKMATEGGRLWMKYGALQYMECQADDLLPWGKDHPGLPFAKLVKLKPSETAWFSFIIYKSKAHRDAVNKKVMKDPAMDPYANADFKMPLDMKRMSQAGFKVVVSL